MQRKRRKKLLAAAALAAAVFAAAGLVNPLSVSVISLRSGKIENTVRIALVSDLHSCRYGEEQRKLIGAIAEQEPDLVCLTGDIFDDEIGDENAERFLSGIAEVCPCYYVTGNHEYRAGEEAFSEKMAILERCGVIRLANGSREIAVNGQTVCLIGVNDPASGSFDLSFIKGTGRQHYSILLSHRPEYFGDYVGAGVDLVLCGHAHGGQWRIPGILENGLLAPDQGLFPKYTSGSFSKDGTTMVVSRGLARESTLVPRFYNRPEIVIIEVRRG